MPGALKTAVGVMLMLAPILLMTAISYAQEVVSSPVAFSSCYLSSKGTLYVWGNDEYLQPVITSTSTPQDSLPVMVKMPSGVTSWKQVATGQSFTLALGDDGNLYAWGYNDFGQLGNGTTADDSVPEMVTKPTGVTSWKAVAAGAAFGMAIANNDSVYAWGYNDFGQLGNGTADGNKNAVPHPTPTVVDLPSGVTATAIAAGNNFGLAIGSNDSLYVWGRNVNGELGIGNKTDQHSPVAAPFPSGVTSWTQIGAGAYTSFALGNDGNLYSAGSNGNGENGDGTTTQHESYSQVNLPGAATAWKSFSAGASFCLGVASNDTLYGWGYGSDGELGNGSTTKNNLTPMPVDLPAGVTVASLTAGHNHSLILGSNGYLYAWGINQAGELGDGSTSESTVPVYVNHGGLSAPMLSGPVSASTLSINDSLVTWAAVSGASSYELQVSDNSGFSSMALDTMGLTGTSFDVRSMLGPVLNLATTYYWRVVAVNSNSGSYSAAWSLTTPGAPQTSGLRLAAETNSHSSYFINAKDTLFAWGDNQYGQLGNGNMVNDSIATAMPFPTGVTGWKMVAAGQGHTVAIDNNDTLYAWGENNHGQLGDGTTADTSLPVMVPLPSGVTSWKSVAAGAFCTIAIGNNDSVYAWGQNSFGELGNGGTSDTSDPVLAPLPAGVTPLQVFAGNNWTMVLATNGTLYATGRNANGELGNGTKVDTSLFEKVDFPAGVTGWLALSGGGYNAIAIGNDGNLYGWGNNGNGQFGNGNNTGVESPLMIAMPSGVTGWVAIASGENYTEAVADNGNIYEAGYSNDGESGNGTKSGRQTMFQIANMLPGVSKYVDVAAGHNHVIAIAQNDSLYAWGANSSYQLGDDSTTNALTPVKVLFSIPAPPVVLVAPGIVGPATGDTLAVSDSALVWMSVPLATSYGVQIASDSAFTNVVVDSMVKMDTTLVIENMLGIKLNPQTKYFWRVVAKNSSSTSAFSSIWSFITPTPTAIQNRGNGLPKTFALLQNYPNPFNPTTVIKYALPKAANVSLSVYNVLGQKVATLVDERQSAGYYEVNFNADRYASGVYFYVFRAGSFSAAHKMMLLK